MIRIKFVAALLVSIVGLVTFNKTLFADNVTQSYSASPNVLPGMIVSLESSNPTTVEALTSSNINKLTGVVVPVNDNPIVLSPSITTNQQVLVASSGRYSVLVDDQNGPIKTGDYLSISSLDGIAMEATSTQKEVIGQAAGSFPATASSVIGKESITNSLNSKQTIDIGEIPVDIKLAPNPLYNENNGNLPGFLSQLSNSIANKPVSPTRVYLSVLTLLLAILISGIIIVTSVHSGIGALGRNPLAKKVIGRGVTKSIVTALIVIAAGVLSVYLILI